MSQAGTDKPKGCGATAVVEWPSHEGHLAIRRYVYSRRGGVYPELLHLVCIQLLVADTARECPLSDADAVSTSRAGRGRQSVDCEETPENCSCLVRLTDPG